MTYSLFDALEAAPWNEAVCPGAVWTPIVIKLAADEGLDIGNPLITANLGGGLL